ncbi:acyltransferase-domain-containing protein [Neohortaea acidophila]|uniref:Acyltransferase-domain-containing protein n=1 Tax=Neohortaea acidophila TaxID=245834 RepID=A0A6A6PYL8_9PEZI|nr:acyltransferase-domain-containing protein [Neohortaea acidophila]KAF2484563.1 acyltransferase-domain-containing protein [Neohortaea acidophila]
MSSELKQRKTGSEQNGPVAAPEPRKLTMEEVVGPSQHGPPMQLLRIVAFGVYFLGSCLFLHAAQLLAWPLYFFNRVAFYDYMSLTKSYFGVLITTMTRLWSPTVIRVSGDKSMKGLLHQKGQHGMLEVDFGERVILIANHQIYTDWLYLWWIAYTNSPPTHGHIYIILKESLRYLPMMGPAMMFFNFIFMSRKWAKDQARLRRRIQKLNTKGGQTPDGKQHLDPMWLLIFPEGTNLSANTRKASARYSAKSGIPDMKHQVLPRSTGLQCCLQGLHTTVDYIYDCTIAYEGIPPGGYGQDIFTLRSVYFQGRAPKSVNMHWRRFAVKDLPIDDADAMGDWIMQRWREKDELIEAFHQTGKFPADLEAVQIEGAPSEKQFKTAYINTQVMPRNSFEFLGMFVPVIAATMVGRIGVRFFDQFLGTKPLFGG